MSLFYRRSIQEMLNHCSLTLSSDQLKTLVAKLNREDKESLAAQWELAVIYAMTASGVIEHERNLKSRPDILWFSRKGLETFLADVTTVSDEGYEGENPREFYGRELSKQATKYGLDSSFFRDEPHYTMIGKHGDQKVKLLYPPINESKRLFNAGFISFIQEIKDGQLEHHTVRLQGEDFDVSIIYQVQKGPYRLGGGNISYNIPYSPTKNPLFNALKIKADQLRKAIYEGPRGIIITDGGCRMLTSGFRDPTGRTYTEEQIVQRFLKGTKSISFVLILTAYRENKLYSQLSPLHIRQKLFVNENARFRISEECITSLLELHKYIPKPKLNADNAARQLRERRDGPQTAWYQGTKMSLRESKKEIKISSRSLAELLAQKISIEKFCDANEIIFNNGNLLNNFLTQGFSISSARLEKLDADDDYIVLVYEPDFAVKAFEIPKQGMRRRLNSVLQNILYKLRAKVPTK